MDFLALPRRDLQALCKRNGVRANMTNVAMADALRALPKVDGIEEYVKQPVPVPELEVKAVVEEKNVGKQGNPLPRDRRAVAKSSEPIEPEEDNEEEKGNAKRQSSKEGAQALGVGRRGASRGARPVPVVPQAAAVAEEELKRESKTDNAAAAPVVGRRGASRRARPSPAMAAQAAESEVAGAEEEQRAQIPHGRRVRAKGSSSEPIWLDDSDDEEMEDAKPEEQQEDTQFLGVGRRGGASRRDQAVPAVASPEAKAEEEHRAPVPRGRRVKANSTEEKKEDTKPEEENGEATAIAVGRRGASRRAPAPSEALATRRSAAASKADAGDVAVEAVPMRDTRQRKPTMKAAAAAGAAEEKAPRRATRRGAVMSTLLQQEVQEEPQEAVGAKDMAVEAVPIRANRQHKLTMKAAAAAATAEEKATPRARRRGAVTRTVLQPEVQEEPQGVFSDTEAVGAPVSYQRCDALEELKKASDPQKEELHEVDAPKQDENQDVVIIEDEKLMEDIPAEEPHVTDQTQEEPHGGFSDTEPVGALVSYHRCDALEEFAEASDPQNEESNEVDTLKKDEDQADQVVTADSLLEQVTGREITVEENTALIVDERQQSMVTMDEDVVEDHSKTDGVHSNEQIEVLTTDKVPELELIEDVIVQADHVVAAKNLPEQVIDSEITVKTTSLIVDEKQQSTVTMDEDVVKDDLATDGVHSNEQMEVVATDKVPELELIEDVFVQADHVLAPENLPEQVIDCKIIVETTSLVVDEKQKSTVTMDIDVVNDHFKTDVVHADEKMDVATTYEVAELIETDDEGAEEMKTPLIVDEKQQSTVTMNGDIVCDHFETHVAHADEQKEVVATEVPEVTGTDSEIEEKTPLIVDEKQQSTGTMDEDVVKDHSETDGVHSNEQMEVVATDKVPELELIEDVFVQADHVLAPENLPKQVIGCKIIVETTSLVVDEKQKSTVTMDIDVVNDHFITDDVHADEQLEVATTDEVAELTETDDEGVEEMKTPLIVDDKQQSTVTTNGDIVCDNFETHVAHADEQNTVTMDGDVVFGHFKTDTAHADEQTEVPDEVTGTDDEVVEEKAVVMTEDIPNQGTVPSFTHAMDGCAKENRFGIDFGHGNEQKKAITADIETEVSRAQDGGARKEIALLEDVTESLSKSIITMEPSLYKNSSGKNSAEPMAVLEEKGVRVASKSDDLTKLSLGQLRAKLKEKLNAKKNIEAKKRVALARVDENVCRSHAKGQQQDLNLQQH